VKIGLLSPPFTLGLSNVCGDVKNFSMFSFEYDELFKVFDYILFMDFQSNSSLCTPSDKLVHKIGNVIMKKKHFQHLNF
jgi:hypothetical protein